MILIVADYGRAALLLSVPIAYALDALTLPQLFIVGFLAGTFTVFFDVAYLSYLPSLVEREQIIEGNSKLEVSRTIAQTSGPGVAGGLIGLITAPYAVLVDAISFFASGAFLTGIRKQEEKVAVPAGRQAADAHRALGGAELRRPAPAAAATGDLHGHLQLLLERDVLDLPRVRGPHARALGR